MANREFRSVGIHHGDGLRRSGYVLACSECGAKEQIAKTCTGNMPNDVVARKFSQKGWTVGHVADRDACPACTRARMMQTRKTKPAAGDQNVVPISAALGVMAEPPRQMSFSERRTILLKIEDVYIDESRGYGSGWSDKRVAEGLGVPVAWVRQLREENFGPEGLSEADRAALAAAEEFQKGLADLARQHAHVSDLQEKLAKEIDELKANFAPLARDVKGIYKAVVRA